jgi:hypothetical protein
MHVQFAASRVTGHGTLTVFDSLSVVGSKVRATIKPADYGF